MDVGPHRDLAGDLNKAVKAKGLKMGYYYSLYEWFNPLYHADVNKYVDEHMIPVPGKIPCEHAWIFKVENAL